MKNALIIINALLVIAVGYLLYKQFDSTKPAKAGNNLTGGRDSTINKKFLFAYIDLDSIQERYDLAKTVQKEIKGRESAVSAEMEKMGKSYQAKLSGYQQKAATMTEEQANAARQDLENSQSQMAEKRQVLTDEFNQFAMSKQMALKKKIEDYLKEFNADGTYSFIFSYEPGLFYYKDSAFDITKQVLKGLNEQLKKDKK